MKILLKRQNNACHLMATNEEGNTVHIDGPPSVGGENKGFRPMELLAAGAGSCSSIDIISILKKQRQKLVDIHIEVTAEREKNKIPSLFTFVHLHYIVKGDLEKEKVEKAIALSLGKYCSVVKILQQTAKISHSYEIIS